MATPAERPPSESKTVFSAGRQKRAWGTFLLSLGSLTSFALAILVLTQALPVETLGALPFTLLWTYGGCRTRRITIIANDAEVIFRNSLRTLRFNATDATRVEPRRKLLQLHRQPAVLLRSGKWVISDTADDLWGTRRLTEALAALSQHLKLPPEN